MKYEDFLRQGSWLKIPHCFGDQATMANMLTTETAYVADSYCPREALF